MKKKVEARITQKKTEIQPISQQNKTYLQTQIFSAKSRSKNQQKQITQKKIEIQ